MIGRFFRPWPVAMAFVAATACYAASCGEGDVISMERPPNPQFANEVRLPAGGYDLIGAENRRARAGAQSMR
jgi:hypothetical protein